MKPVNPYTTYGTEYLSDRSLIDRNYSVVAKRKAWQEGSEALKTWLTEPCTEHFIIDPNKHSESATTDMAWLCPDHRKDCSECWMEITND